MLRKEGTCQLLPLLLQHQLPQETCPYLMLPHMSKRLSLQPQDENHSLLVTPEMGHPWPPCATGSPQTCALSLMPSFFPLPRRGVQAQPLYVGYCDQEFGGV